MAYNVNYGYLCCRFKTLESQFNSVNMLNSIPISQESTSQDYNRT